LAIIISLATNVTNVEVITTFQGNNLWWRWSF